MGGLLGRGGPGRDVEAVDQVGGQRGRRQPEHHLEAVKTQWKGK